MKVYVLAVGRPMRLLSEAVEEYEKRAARYWPLEVVEVREERSGRNADPERIRAAEGERLWERVPAGVETVALTRTGDALSSRELAAWLQQRALESHPGVAFLIGGALGLSDDVMARCTRTLRLSSMTLPHELARLVLAEQLYRAGTIVRNEPYHKGA
ncbi:MAG: 23S rRNA (pseudouridine(1915)-N(3))-methyltransferase RlmH [Candidatus Cloacimonetes bacterium]|nr:23S rRNA (pseudouridine(1915)-N(3))-methyltransferase RlmH [Candidatus Cloacimonadota bacterium]